MKRIFTFAFLAFTFSASSFAQSEMDAFNLSYNDLTGTARAVSMGGAFGALGGDATGVAINPAGIGVYTTSEIVTTLNFTNTKSEANLLGSKADDSKFKFNFDNISFVGAFPLNSDDVPFINFGFAYNKLKSFDRKVAMKGSNLNQSFVDYLTDRANGTNNFDYITTSKKFGDGDWLSIMGYDGGLILKNPDGSKTFVPNLGKNELVNNNLYLREKGYISSYDVNVGTTIADMISVGATISVTDIDYHLTSEYSESFQSGGNFYLTNWLKTEGNGWQVKAGMIFKPVNELRIGVAYHSPTWYNMTDYAYGEMDALGNEIVGTPDDPIDYKFRTPDKWVFSLAGVIGQYAIISADYELTNYSRMHGSNRDGDVVPYYASLNSNIKEDFKNSSTLRVGAEVRFTPQFSGRVGYMWQQSPVKDNLKNGSVNGTYTASLPYDRTFPHYSIVGDANHFTWGLGYKFTPSFYTDVAFVVKSRKDDLYNYGGADKAGLKTNQFSGLLTFGYRF